MYILVLQCMSTYCIIIFINYYIVNGYNYNTKLKIIIRRHNKHNKL